MSFDFITGTTSNEFNLGNQNPIDGYVSIFANYLGNKPCVRYNFLSTKWEMSNDGITYFSISAFDTSALDGYATKNELLNYYTKQESGDILDGYVNNTTITNYYTKQATGDILDGYVANSDLTNYYTIPQTNNLMDGYKPSPQIGSTWTNTGRMYVQKAEGPSVAAGATYTILDIDGEGYMNQFFMSVRCTDAAGRQNSRLQIYVDGELTPSINVMMVDLAAARGCEGAGGAGAISAQFMTRYIGFASLAFTWGVGYYIYIDIPFSTHIKVDVVNGSATTAAILGGYVQYYLQSGLTWGKYKKLHGVSLATTSVPKYVEVSLLEILGDGLLHGMYLYFNGGDNNYNYLEANPKIFIDDDGYDEDGYYDGYASCTYDSTEDYFLFPWYFWTANATRNVCTDFVGCTRKDDVDQVGAYRWHIRDPIPFSTKLKVNWTNGEPASGAVVVNNTVVNGVIWYYSRY